MNSPVIFVGALPRWPHPGDGVGERDRQTDVTERITTTACICGSIRESRFNEKRLETGGLKKTG